MYRLAFSVLFLGACTPTTDPLDTDELADSQLDTEGTEEICNGVDDNGDGKIDEDVQISWHEDLDDDGYGGAEVWGCEVPTDALTDLTDCNDGDADINPGAQEICDGQDNNCDLNIDDLSTTWDFQADVEPSTVSLVGDAVQRDGAGGARFLLLTAPSPVLVGAAWLSPQLPAPEFKVTARFYMTGTADDTSDGEGMALVIAEDGATNALGDAGPSLGIYGAEVTGLVIELDQFGQGPFDTVSEQHVAITDPFDAAELAVSTSVGELGGGVWNTVELTVTDDTAYVKINDLQVLTAPVSFTGGPLTIGFTAATSANKNQGHRVDDVVMTCPEL
jgi:hypothetical protein